MSEDQDLVFLCNGADAPRMAASAKNGVRIFPLSQTAYAAARTAGQELVGGDIWKVLSSVDLTELDKAADKAVRVAIESGDIVSSIDRAALWHRTRESAYVRAVATRAIEVFAPDKVLLTGDDEWARKPVANVCKEFGIQTADLTPSLGSAPIAPRPDPPASQTADLQNLPSGEEWGLVIGVGVTDWNSVLFEIARRDGPTLIIIDPQSSGNLGELYRVCRGNRNIRFLPLWLHLASSYQEAGDNSGYIDALKILFGRLAEARPNWGLSSDMNRPEIVLALDMLNTRGAHATILSHSSTPMQFPYALDPEMIAGATTIAWIRSAADPERATIIRTPPRIRTSAPKRLARLLTRTPSFTGHARKIGLVVTTGAFIASPQQNLQEMFEAAQALAKFTAKASLKLAIRVREKEDDPELWRSFTSPNANATVETSGERPAIAFLRSCDLVLELGTASTAFLEAAGNFVPYIRLSPNDHTGRAGLRPHGLVPIAQIDNLEESLGAYLRSGGRRLNLAGKQHRWLLAETSD